MIIYDARKFAGLEVLIHATGSALYTWRTLVPALICGAITLVLSYDQNAIDWLEEHIDSATPLFNSLTFIVNLVVVTRMQMAFKRFQQAQQAYFTMASRLQDIACWLESFIVNKTPKSNELKKNLLRWIRLCHELALEDLQGFEFKPRNRKTILTDEEGILLAQERKRSVRVLGWVVTSLVKYRSELKVGDPILSAVYRFIGEANISFNTARRISETPYPFAFAQVTMLMILAWSFLSPVVWARYFPTSDGYSFLVSFFSTWSLFAINEASSGLEAPFDDSVNDLPLVYYSVSFNDDISGIEFMQLPGILADEEEEDKCAKMDIKSSLPNNAKDNEEVKRLPSRNFANMQDSIRVNKTDTLITPQMVKMDLGQAFPSLAMDRSSISVQNQEVVPVARFRPSKILVPTKNEESYFYGYHKLIGIPSLSKIKNKGITLSNDQGLDIGDYGIRPVHVGIVSDDIEMLEMIQMRSKRMIEPSANAMPKHQISLTFVPQEVKFLKKQKDISELDIKKKEEHHIRFSNLTSKQNKTEEKEKEENNNDSSSLNQIDSKVYLTIAGDTGTDLKRQIQQLREEVRCGIAVEVLDAYRRKRAHRKMARRHFHSFRESSSNEDDQERKRIETAISSLSQAKKSGIPKPTMKKSGFFTRGESIDPENDFRTTIESPSVIRARGAFVKLR